MSLSEVGFFRFNHAGFGALSRIPFNTDRSAHVLCLRPSISFWSSATKYVDVLVKATRQARRPQIGNDTDLIAHRSHGNVLQCCTSPTSTVLPWSS